MNLAVSLHVLTDDSREVYVDRQAQPHVRGAPRCRITPRAGAPAKRASRVRVKIAPSILSADFGRLAAQVQEAEKAGADYIHVDVMDGHFAPNITMGPVLVSAVAEATSLPLDVHLMIECPERYLEAFVKAGASIVTVHREACRSPEQVIAAIHRLGARAGVALSPATPFGSVKPLLGETELLLIMSVNPGFGGQPFISSSVRKVERARELLDSVRSAAELEVDGGVSPDNAALLSRAGATVLVAGSAVFNRKGTVAENLAALRAALSSQGF